MNRDFWKTMAEKWSLPLDSKAEKTAIAQIAEAHAQKDKKIISNYSINPLDDDDEEDEDEFW